MTTANDQIACPECGYGWNEFTHGFHYTHCSKAAHLNHEQITYRCPNCGQVDSHADECPSNSQRYDDDAPAAPERGEWRYIETRYSAEVALNDNLRLRAHWTGTLDRDEIRTLMQGVVTEHNQHSTLVTQRERLLAIARDALRFREEMNGKCDHDQMMPKLCSQCEIRGVITTSEQEGRR